MRCLFRLVGFVVVASLAIGAWLYRDEIRHWWNQRTHPAEAAQQAGHPSARMLARARGSIDAMRHNGRDSIVISSDEMASLLADGVRLLPGAALDSLSIELEDGEIRMRTVVDSARIPSRLRALVPGRSGYLDVTASGPLVPVRTGLAEFRPQHIAIHGVPVPRELAAPALGKLRGAIDADQLDIALPAEVGGFRVRPTGVTIYRAGVR